MLEIDIAIARTPDYPALGRLYSAWGYGAGIGAADRVYVARLRGQPIGLVRRTDEQSILMLRGMHVAPDFQGRGVGSELLRVFASELPARECYCIPFSHLTRFYGRQGFERDDEVAAPAFLRERLATYRAEGHDVLLMRRPARLYRDRAS